MRTTFWLAMGIAACTSLALAMAAPGAARPGPVPVQDDNDERAAKLARGQQAFRDNCLMCHAEELTTTQRLTAKQWQTEVDKMVGWGAPVPPEQKEPLLAYLTQNYSDKAPAPHLARATLDEMLATVLPQHLTAPGHPDRGKELYTKHCATCHGPDGRGGDLGTNLVEKPVLLREADYNKVVRQGLRRMPGFALAITADDQAEILAWLRQLRYEGPESAAGKAKK